MLEVFCVELDGLKKRLQAREIFTLTRSDFIEDRHIIPTHDSLQHASSVNCECLPEFIRSTSTGLTGDSSIVIHRQISEVLV